MTTDALLVKIAEPGISSDIVGLVEKVNRLDHKYRCAMQLIADKIALEFIGRNWNELNLKEKAVVLHLEDFAILARDSDGIVRPWLEVTTK